MADYFTHFSCLLHVGTAENVTRALELYNAPTDADDQIPHSEGFCLSVQSDEHHNVLWIYDETSGDPEAVIQFVKRCASEFGLAGYWGFTYSETCSRPQIGAFGGGAHVFNLATGETVEWLNAGCWLSKVLADDPGGAS